jgi:hypothetical protein
LSFIQERKKVVNAGSCRISPLLAQPGREADLPYAPAPWMLKQCLETGMIFLANPPAYEALSETYAYERTFLQAADARRQAEPIRFRFSAQLKRFRKFVMKRHKMLAMLHERIADAASPQVNVLDVGCGWGELLQLMMASLPRHLHGRVLPHGVNWRACRTPGWRRLAAAACTHRPGTACSCLPTTTSM